jgi:hypothetical protein
MQEQSVKDRLARENDLALERGVFGSPFFFVEGEPFWGSDRMDQIAGDWGSTRTPLKHSRTFSRSLASAAFCTRKPIKRVAFRRGSIYWAQLRRLLSSEAEVLSGSPPAQVLIRRHPQLWRGRSHQRGASLQPISAWTTL